MRFAEINNPISAVSYANINPMLAIRNIEQHDKATDDVLTEENKTYNSILNDGTLDPDTKQARLKAVRDNLNQIHAQFQGNLGAARPAILAYTQKEMTDPYWQTDKQLFEKYKNFQDTVSKGKAEGHDFYYEDENGQTVSNPNDMFRPYDNMGNLRNPASVNVNPVKILNAYTAAEHMFDSIGDNISESYVPGKDALADYFVANKNKSNRNQIAALEKNAVDIFSMTPEGQQYRKHNGYEKTANLLHDIAQSKIVKEQTQKIEIDQAKQNELNRQNDIEKAATKAGNKTPSYDWSPKSQGSKPYVPLTNDQVQKHAAGMQLVGDQGKIAEYINRRNYKNSTGEGSVIVLGGQNPAAAGKVTQGLKNMLNLSSKKIGDGDEYFAGNTEITQGGQLRIPAKDGSYMLLSPDGNLRTFRRNKNGSYQEPTSEKKEIANDLASNLRQLRYLNWFEFGSGVNGKGQADVYKKYQSPKLGIAFKKGQNGELHKVEDLVLTHKIIDNGAGLEDAVIEEYTYPQIQSDGTVVKTKVKNVVPIAQYRSEIRDAILSEPLNSSTTEPKQ